MKFTFYGHACFMVELKGKKILFDPFIRDNDLATGVNFEQIIVDYIFLSHGHEDHVADAFDIAMRNDATIVSNYEVATWFQKKGVKNTHPMNHGGSWNFDFGTAKFVNAVHSSMLPDGSYGGNAGGFVIESDTKNFYYSGDTALTMDMKLIPLTSKKLDFSILPIGDNFTMGAHEAVLAAEFVGTTKVVGVHFDTFGYIKINQSIAKEVFASKGKELILLNIGETIEL